MRDNLTGLQNTSISISRCETDSDTAKNFTSFSSNSVSVQLEDEYNRNNNFFMEIVKLLIAFLCLSISAFSNFFLLTLIHDIVPRKPLPDLVFILIPQQKWAWPVGDVLSTVNSVIAFIVVLLHRERIIIFRRLFILGAIMYGLRAVIMAVTYLPPSFNNRDEICEPQLNRTGVYWDEVMKRFLTYVVTLGLTSSQEKILCGDLMFSGHTIVLSIMYFTTLKYTPRKLALLRYIVTPITFCGMAALVVSGGHYSMDVLIAYWISSHVFWSYHQVFELPLHMRKNQNLSRLWWFHLAYWFENTVPSGPIKNIWNWPLGKPKFMKKFIEKCNKRLK
uniref:PAP2_C domain-containing protein n=1 Tax=Strongyloides venezuelensis TaxID=75913 RepID=A0A0K0FMC6_STRVS